MAKGARGGKLSGGGSGSSNIGRGVNGGGGGLGSLLNQQAAQPVQPVQPAQSISAGYNQFMTMSDDNKADVISTMSKQGVPVHLSDTDFQRFIYNLGLNDKPELVDDATLKSMQGQSIYRTVNSVYDRKNDISYTADQICKQVQSGRVTRTSDNGGSVYGRGLYFADSKSDSALYGNTRGNTKKTAMMTAKLNSNAKVINYYSAYSGYDKEIKSGSKLGKALKQCDLKSGISIYAMAKGYNVITNGNGYLNVLNRQAITLSKSISSI